jgi:hypothetical protein
MQFVWDKVLIILHGIKGKSCWSKEFLPLYPEAAENSKEMLEQNLKGKEEERKHGLEEHEVTFTKLELNPNRKKEEEWSQGWKGRE